MFWQGLRQALCLRRYHLYPHLQSDLSDLREQLKIMVNTLDSPGRSTKDKSATSGPLISRQTQFFEKLSSLSGGSSSCPSRKSRRAVLGFKIARWARRIRSSTSSLLWITPPNASLRIWRTGWPFTSVMKRKVMAHCQGSEEDMRRHSVGTLAKSQRCEVMYIWRREILTEYMSHWHEAEWCQRLTRWVRTSPHFVSRWRQWLVSQYRAEHYIYLSFTRTRMNWWHIYPVLWSLFTRSSICLRLVEYWGSERPTGVVPVGTDETVNIFVAEGM